MKRNLTKQSVAKVVLALIGAASFSAFAQTPSSATIDQRQARQETRLANGLASGELTTTEATRLQARQNRIQRAENKAQADGLVTQGEAKKINHLQSHASHGIYRQKHDRQTDYNHDGVRDNKVLKAKK